MFEPGQVVYVCDFNDSEKQYELRQLEYVNPSTWFSLSDWSWVNVSQPEAFVDEPWMEYDGNLFASAEEAIQHQMDMCGDAIRDLLRRKEQLRTMLGSL